MSAELDIQVVALLSKIIDTHPEDALLVRKLWKDRQDLLETMRSIHDWDKLSAEARSLDQVDILIEDVFERLAEEL